MRIWCQPLSLTALPAQSFRCLSPEPKAFKPLKLEGAIKVEGGCSCGGCRFALPRPLQFGISALYRVRPSMPNVLSHPTGFPKSFSTATAAAVGSPPDAASAIIFCWVCLVVLEGGEEGAAPRFFRGSDPLVLQGLQICLFWQRVSTVWYPR